MLLDASGLTHRLWLREERQADAGRCLPVLPAGAVTKALLDCAVQIPTPSLELWQKRQWKTAEMGIRDVEHTQSL